MIAIPVRCEVCGTVIFVYRPDIKAIVLVAKHHGEKHTSVVSLDQLRKLEGADAQAPSG